MKEMVEIIGKLSKRNFKNVFSGLGRSLRQRGLDFPKAIANNVLASGGLRRFLMVSFQTEGQKTIGRGHVSQGLRRRKGRLIRSTTAQYFA
jgi:hypothetical protein